MNALLKLNNAQNRFNGAHTVETGSDRSFCPHDADKWFRPRWFALQTRSRHEKLVYRELLTKNLEPFLPLRQVQRLWSDRQVVVEEPLFKGYLFVKMPFASRWDVLNTVGAVRFVGIKPSDPWEIPEKDVQAVRRFVDERLRVDPFPYLKQGQRVRVTKGPLADVEGFLVEKANRFRLVISIELMMQSVAIHIDGNAVEAVD